MIYMENDDGRGKGWARVFSAGDSQRELDKFRCIVRAPRQALHTRKSKHDRVHLLLFGKPRHIASLMTPPKLVFASPAERIAWEATQAEIMKKHPTPYLEEQK